MSWRECDMAEFVNLERRAGFYNTMGAQSLPATGGFSDGTLQGRTVYDVNTADQYGWDKEFQKVAFPNV